MQRDTFLERLQSQAAKQAVLNKERIFPSQLDGLTSFIGNYPWQTLIVVSILSALCLELVMRSGV